MNLKIHSETPISNFLYSIIIILQKIFFESENTLQNTYFGNCFRTFRIKFFGSYFFGFGIPFEIFNPKTT